MTKLEKIGADLKRARVKQAEWTRRVRIWKTVIVKRKTA